MEVVEIRAQQAAESILDNERLTAGLDDEAAQVLNEWGLAWSGKIANSTSSMDDATASEYLEMRLKAIRRLMRYVNEWARKRALMNPAEEHEHLNKIDESAQVVHGLGPNSDTLSGDTQRTLYLDEACALDGDPSALIVGLRHLIENTLTDGNNIQTAENPH